MLLVLRPTSLRPSNRSQIDLQINLRLLRLVSKRPSPGSSDRCQGTHRGHGSEHRPVSGSPFLPASVATPPRMHPISSDLRRSPFLQPQMFPQRHPPPKRARTRHPPPAPLLEVCLGPAELPRSASVGPKALVGRTKGAG